MSHWGIKIVFSCFIIIAYYVILEWNTGRTLGKLVMGTKVIDESGGNPSFKQIIGRSFARLIPFEAFTFFGRQSHGLHDKLSKTYVIKTR